MPTYEYLCENCGYQFERFQSITARTIRKCPQCGKTNLKRLIGTGSGVIFKGSGFYQTDYRTESYKRGEKSEKGTTDTVTGKKETGTATAAEDAKSEKVPERGTKGKKKSA